MEGSDKCVIEKNVTEDEEIKRLRGKGVKWSSM